MKEFWGDWLGLIFVLAILFMLFRPSSKAAQLVDAVGQMLVSMVRRATDVAA